MQDYKRISLDRFRDVEFISGAFDEKMRQLCSKLNVLPGAMHFAFAAVRGIPTRCNGDLA